MESTPPPARLRVIDGAGFETAKPKASWIGVMDGVMDGVWAVPYHFGPERRQSERRDGCYEQIVERLANQWVNRP